MNSDYKYQLLDDALNDIDNITDYIVDNFKDKQLAIKLIDKLVKAFLLLEIMPFSCPLLNSNKNDKLKLRKCTIGQYIAVYSVNEKNKVILIERVFHRLQNYTELF
jgi:addiction module RelE/StbE family toxin